MPVLQRLQAVSTIMWRPYLLSGCSFGNSRWGNAIHRQMQLVHTGHASSHLRNRRCGSFWWHNLCHHIWNVACTRTKCKYIITKKWNIFLCTYVSYISDNFCCCAFYKTYVLAKMYDITTLTNWTWCLVAIPTKTS